MTEAEREYYRQVILPALFAGSNITKYATGNASGTVGFNKGPQTAQFGGPGSERYGIEGPDVGWWNRVGAAAPAGGVGYTGVGYTGPGGGAVPAYGAAAGAPSMDVPTTNEGFLARFAGALPTFRAPAYQPMQLPQMGVIPQFRHLARPL